MSLRNKKPEDNGPGVPAYIVTFSDMITLLLTFFVLLLSMASEKNTAKFKVGQEAFKRSLANFGLKGILYAMSSSSDFDESMISYPIKDKDPEESLTPINAQEEQLRRLFSQLNEEMDVRPSQIRGKLTDLITPEIIFKPASTNLTDKHKQKISEICSELSLTASSANFTIYVVGLAPNLSSQKQWITAAQRSQNTANYMRSKLPDNFIIYNWGTANPTDWIHSAKSKDIESDIIIALLQ